MSIDRDTELRRLARVLHREPAQLGHLAALDGAGLMKLRTLIQNSLLEEFASLFEKIAASGKLAPDALSALLCRKVFGASITANMSYYVPPDRAARMCKHFDDEFMAEIAREQIPERAKEQLEKLPVDLMRGVTRQMLASRDYHIMGGFTDYLPEDKAMVLMEEIADPADSLRISSFAQRKDRIARLTAKMDDGQIRSLIAAAFERPEFIHEVGLVTSEMGEKDQQRMARLTDEVSKKHRATAKAVAEKSGTVEKLRAFFAA
ncbi:hypothetical protein D0B54_16425 [Solimonas sp. K1W22B-7]|uniref:hypothetical protein n=1 Tax=Solimonas sp. K1W22B-7 TaxID=2303331 RepID=UPI000E335405|nr:hypothetical protein [Solimonas sp. K1W22B-7]AXQ30160.1 hypothetical protein D0B54_16425 [Solimonas sp. K1W22B-7]